MDRKKGFRRRIALVVSTALIVGPVFFTVSLAAFPVKRGQCPECQEECLRRHTEKMEELARVYRRTGNRLDYQNGVDNLSLDYETCLDNCREPYPVK